MVWVEPLSPRSGEAGNARPAKRFAITAPTVAPAKTKASGNPIFRTRVDIAQEKTSELNLVLEVPPGRVTVAKQELPMAPVAHCVKSVTLRRYAPVPLKLVLTAVPQTVEVPAPFTRQRLTVTAPAMFASLPNAMALVTVDGERSVEYGKGTRMAALLPPGAQAPLPRVAPDAEVAAHCAALTTSVNAAAGVGSAPTNAIVRQPMRRPSTAALRNSSNISSYVSLPCKARSASDRSRPTKIPKSADGIFIAWS